MFGGYLSSLFNNPLYIYIYTVYIQYKSIVAELMDSPSTLLLTKRKLVKKDWIGKRRAPLHTYQTLLSYCTCVEDRYYRSCELSKVDDFTHLCLPECSALLPLLRAC